MTIPSDILEGINSFIKTATNFSEIIEKNIESYYKIKDKVSGRRQLESIEHVLSLFPQIWFFNGLFAISFLEGVKDADGFAKNRDNPTIDQFEKALDDVEKIFDNEAPKIRGLGSEMIVLFKQQIALRRKLIGDSRNENAIKDDDIKKMIARLEPLRLVEQRFYMLTWKFRDDSIREAALQNPGLSDDELAQKLHVTDLVVRGVLRDNRSKGRAHKS
jgi:hypothetical protein